MNDEFIMNDELINDEFINVSHFFINYITISR